MLPSIIITNFVISFRGYSPGTRIFTMDQISMQIKFVAGRDGIWKLKFVIYGRIENMRNWEINQYVCKHERV